MNKTLLLRGLMATASGFATGLLLTVIAGAMAVLAVQLHMVGSIHLFRDFAILWVERSAGGIHVSVRSAVLLPGMLSAVVSLCLLLLAQGRNAQG